eukprot:309631_1
MVNGLIIHQMVHKKRSYSIGPYPDTPPSANRLYIGSDAIVRGDTKSDSGLDPVIMYVLIGAGAFVGVIAIVIIWYCCCRGGATRNDSEGKKYSGVAKKAPTTGAAMTTTKKTTPKPQPKPKPKPKPAPKTKPQPKPKDR